MKKKKKRFGEKKILLYNFLLLFLGNQTHNTQYIENKTNNQSLISSNLQPQMRQIRLWLNLSHINLKFLLSFSSC